MFKWFRKLKLIRYATIGNLAGVKHCVEDLSIDANSQIIIFSPLYSAAEKNHKDIVDYLLQDKRLLYPALITSIKMDEPHTFKCLIEHSKIDINTRFGADNMTLLHIAAKAGSRKIVECLLDMRADANARVQLSENIKIANGTGYTKQPRPIDLAAHYGKHSSDLVEFMSKYAGNKMIEAVEKGDLDTVKFLIEDQLYDPAPMVTQLVTPLYAAARANQGAVVDYLLLDDRTLNDALYISIDADDTVALQCLVEHSKIDVNKKMWNPTTQYTFLHRAAEMGSMRVAEYLLEIAPDLIGVRAEFKGYKVRCADGLNSTYNPLPIDVAYNAMCNADDKNKFSQMTMFLRNYARGVRRNKKELLTTNVVSNDLTETQFDFEQNRVRALKIVREIQTNGEEVQKLALVGELCKIMTTFDYEKSKSVYDEIASKVDKDIRQKIETAIRENRQRS